MTLQLVSAFRVTLVCVLWLISGFAVANEPGSARFDRTSLVVQQMDSSVVFWRDVMGFELVLEPRTLPSTNNPYLGWTEDAVVRFARFVSPDGAGLGLLEVQQPGFPSLKIKDHATGHGGVILVMVATDIEALYKRAVKAKAVLKPLGLSATGLSKHMYLKSPSGHALELYELLTEADQASR
ncbi:MAG: VOC family protein [Pseudomonadota bacterium]